MLRPSLPRRTNESAYLQKLAAKKIVILSCSKRIGEESQPMSTRDTLSMAQARPQSI